MQIYMHLTGLTRAMYVAVCKDTDDLHIERVRADGDAAERLLAKAGRVIHAARPPARISEDPDLVRVPVLRPPRPLPWRRRRRGHLPLLPAFDAGRGRLALRPLGPGARRPGSSAPACARHLFIPDLVPGEVVDAGDDHVVYRMRDGATWMNDARAEAVAC